MISNFAGKIYNQYDSLLKQISNTEDLDSKVKKFSGGGLLTRSSGLSSDNDISSNVSMREEQLRIPLLAMREIRKRREELKMELKDLEPRFENPIPGMGLTHEVGARPWQSPAQYTKMEDIVDYYVSRMADDSFQQQLLNVMESGIPLTSLANTIQLASVMEGVHSIDTGLLVMPVLIELMMLIAEQNDIKYTSGMERNKKKKEKTLLFRMLWQSLLKKKQKKVKN